MTPELQNKIVALINLLPKAEQIIGNGEIPIDFISSEINPAITTIKMSFEEINDEALKKDILAVEDFCGKAEKRIHPAMKKLYTSAISQQLLNNSVMEACMSDIRDGSSRFKSGLKALRAVKRRAEKLNISVESQ